ncbi:PREDICTED: fatty acid 2-hydroxylase [Nicrophorus vespilloides]|uniref:Fatty acid 2-hydroxylase n=1 Tax=Nicrophorus vespilloides TaxID=110193 RepID=A0ABM1MI36_NICVS|nr:PREDICTED: fatty acid 2-hydroxylase [Nicrophorus vespilloides]XP_017774236.1 PREDICTED: fatty acid 2-hydroxylase [Nicrophorus vespilloides]XP_017774237.1 PREDICTED: fatty acid 2-hydroxylase [Nicrophorus vespilloides]
MDGFQVRFCGEGYELKDFLKFHPGGINYLSGYKDKDVGLRMESTQHSQSAFYLLREYREGGRNIEMFKENEDLEYLVNWNEPMLKQVSNLGTKYSEWVHSPVNRKLRIFENPFLESLTITPWYFVPIVWIPIILYYIHKGHQTYSNIHKESNSVIWSVIYLSVGVVMWTLLEYSLHRWVFHLVPSGKSRALICLHFTIHGLHHKVPFDTRRLVFPPIPAIFILVLGHTLLSSIIPKSMIHLLLGGIISGYLIYDMIHFYLHYGTPDIGGYLYNMKRIHNQHHFTHHDAAFGISSNCWDKLFGTIIYLRKLGMGIKWN